MVKEFFRNLWNTIRSRTFFLSLIFIGLFFILLVRVFQLQIVNGESYLNDYLYQSKRTLDIDSTKTCLGLNGNLQLMTTGGGKYELPMDKNYDSIRVISYIGYDESGMAYIYDDRLAGFATLGGGD